MARRGGGGGTASATAAVGSNVPRAIRSAAAAFFARMDVRRRRWRGRRCYRADGYESRCWMVRLEGGGRAKLSVVVATEDDDDGWDLPPPPARQRWMRRCRCPLRPTTKTTKTRARDDATQREGGGGDDKGQASGDDSPSRRDAAELEALWRCERSGDMSLSGEVSDHVEEVKKPVPLFLRVPLF